MARGYGHARSPGLLAWLLCLGLLSGSLWAAPPAPQAERVAPQDPRVNIERAKCRVQAGQTAEALDDFKKAVAKDPGNESAWQGATELLQKSGRQHEAADFWSEGMRKNPQWSEKESAPPAQSL